MTSLSHRQVHLKYSFTHNDTLHREIDICSALDHSWDLSSDGAHVVLIPVDPLSRPATQAQLKQISTLFPHLGCKV